MLVDRALPSGAQLCEKDHLEADQPRCCHFRCKNDKGRDTSWTYYICTLYLGIIL